MLTEVRAVSVNASDWETLRGRPMYARIDGPFRPRHRVLGSDIAGRVVAVGPGVTAFQTGDEVFGDILGQKGGFAEYARAKTDALARIPAGLSFVEAAAIPQAGVIALQGIEQKGRVRAGQRVLVTGAGGGAGSFAVQLAKRAGAEVTAVDRAAKFDLMRGLGADQVVDFTVTDITRTGERYDLILDLSAHRSVLHYRRALTSGGRYLYVGGTVPTLLQALLLGPLIGRSAHLGLLVVQPNPTDLLEVAQRCVDGTLRPVIDREYPLDEVPAALTYLGEGHAKGKVVITLQDPSHR